MSKVTPDELYTATPIQRFINQCRNREVNWAIFSDKYGVWFPGIGHEWYEKNPGKVTEEEFNRLVDGFNKVLSQFDEIHFYYNPGRFHNLYKRLLESSELKTKIKPFTHIEEISNN